MKQAKKAKILKRNWVLKFRLFKLAFFAVFAYICTPKPFIGILDIAQPAP